MDLAEEIPEAELWQLTGMEKEGAGI